VYEGLHGNLENKNSEFRSVYHGDRLVADLTQDALWSSSYMLCLTVRLIAYLLCMCFYRKQRVNCCVSATSSKKCLHVTSAHYFLV
jgi:hypothetical protein